MPRIGFALLVAVVLLSLGILVTLHTPARSAESNPPVMDCAFRLDEVFALWTMAGNPIAIGQAGCIPR